MKTFLFILMCAFFIQSDNAKFNKETCTCNDIKLYGTVRVVKGSADFTVRVVTGSADLDVRAVDGHPSRCGEWRFTDGAADFTVRFTDGAADFTIRYKN